MVDGASFLLSLPDDALFLSETVQAEKQQEVMHKKCFCSCEKAVCTRDM